MIYSASTLPTFSKSTAVGISSRYCGRLVLPLSFCIMLMGCDSQSAADTSVNTKVANDSIIRTLKSGDVSPELQQHNNVDADEDRDDKDEGQSLIAIAKTDDSARTRRVPMVSEKGSDSTLQATLIGDYKGMLPCSFCDGISLTLNLFADGSVLKTSIYENPQSPHVPLVESGVYRQDNNIITIVYQDKAIEIYHIQDNHLVMLDKNKTPDPDYTLSRK